MIETLIANLKAALTDEEVSFAEAVPNTLIAPSVVVAPGDPFITNTTHGLIQERWEILVVMKRVDPDRGVKRLRRTSLLIRDAVSSAGAVWESTSGPRTVDGDSDFVLMVNVIHFKYAPSSILEEEESSS